MRKLLPIVLCILAALGMGACQKEDAATVPAPPRAEKEAPAPSFSEEDPASSRAEQILQSSPDILPKLPSQTSPKRPDELLPQVPSDLRPTHPSPQEKVPLPTLPEEKNSVSIGKSSSADHLKRLIEQRISPRERGCVSSSGNKLTVFCKDRDTASKVKDIFLEHKEYQDAAVYVSYSPYTMERLYAVCEEMEQALIEKVPDTQLKYHQNYAQILESKNAVALLVESENMDVMQKFLASYEERNAVDLYGREFLSLSDGFEQGAVSLRDRLIQEIKEDERGTLYAQPESKVLLVNTPSTEKEAAIQEKIHALAQGGAFSCTVFYHRSPLSLAQTRSIQQELTRSPHLYGVLESISIDPALCRVEVYLRAESAPFLDFLDTYEHRSAVTVFERIHVNG